MNKGHGHVRPNADGTLARCGGPAICHVCALEQAQLDAELRSKVADEPADMLLFMDRAVTAWARWINYSSEHLGFPHYAWCIDLRVPTKNTYLDLSDDQFVAIDRAVAKLDRFYRLLILKEWCSHEPMAQRAITFNVSRATYREMVDDVLTQLYHALLPDVDDWRRRAPGFRQ